jgi:hypothetical protein
VRAPGFLASGPQFSSVDHNCEHLPETAC